MAIDRPTDAHRVFERLYNAGDLEGLVALYEERAKLVTTRGEVVGRDAIRESIGKFLEVNGKMRIETIGIVEGDGVAVISAIWRVEGDGGHILMQGESVEVWRKGKDGWLTAIDCPFGVG